MPPNRNVTAYLGGIRSENHASQDYQMQMILLDQQNRKLLLQHRQEQNAVRPTSDLEQPPQPQLSVHRLPTAQYAMQEHEALMQRRMASLQKNGMAADKEQNAVGKLTP